MQTPSVLGKSYTSQNEKVQQPSIKRGSVHVNQLNVRAAGDFEAKVLAQLNVGTNVEILEVDEKWTKIKAGKVTGFVFSSYLVMEANKISRSSDMFATRVKQIIEPLMGIPYRYGGTTPEGFDCSGFIKYVMGQLGVKLPRVSEDQFTVGKKVEKEDLQVGDLLFFLIPSIWERFHM